jgi:hypothetical protein
MTENDVRDTIVTTPLPRPRTAADDTVAPVEVAAGGDEPRRDEPRRPEPSFPWPEPWHFSRAARPRTEYWDVETAGWRSRGPQAGSRTGD